MARRAGHTFLCGLACYEQDEDMAHGLILQAGHFIAMDILDPAPVLAALVHAIEKSAQQLGCSAVRAVVHQGQTHLTNSLLAGGHFPEATLMVKQILNSGG